MFGTASLFGCACLTAFVWDCVLVWLRGKQSPQGSNLNDLVVQLICRTWRGASQRFEEDIATGLDLNLLQVLLDGVVGYLGVVVLQGQVAEPDVSQPWMPVTLQERATGVVALMTARTKDSFLEVSGVRTVEQHMLVMVRLDHKVVCRTDIRLHLVVHRTAVGHQHKSLIHIIDAVAQTIGGVMLNVESVDLHVEQIPFLAFLEIPAARSELLADSVVAVYTLVDLGGGVNRNLHPLTQGTYRTDMIRMIVRDQNTHDIGEIEIHLAQVLLNLPGRDACVYQHPSLTGTEIVTITATTARKTPEYESVFLHSIKKSCKDTKKFAYMQEFL